MAEVNLKHIWDVVSQIRVGRTGRAYVVDARGTAPGSSRHQPCAAKDGSFPAQPGQIGPRGSRAESPTSRRRSALDLRGERVCTAFAPADPLKWLVFVELPEGEANAPLYGALTRSVVVLLAGLLLAFLMAVLLARRMAVPIQALTSGAARIGTGALDHRIAITTGDELEALGDQFNHMASQLQSSYATLERKVDERTHQLQLANLSKSRFLAAASHDLRQPLHALNLFVAQLRSEADPAERNRLAARIEAAIDNMNGLFNGLLDISKLDSGAMKPSISDFPIGSILKHMASTFAATAREKGLSLRVVPSRAWVRSDAILLERILLNLVSNAVRYTETGGVVVGCRRKGDKLRIDVCDTGSGIAADQQRNIFNEFYQLVPKEKGGRDGLGLGLAIVERLGALLDHPIGLESTLGKGSRFSVTVPMVQRPSRQSRSRQRRDQVADRRAARQVDCGDRRRCAGAGRNAWVVGAVGLQRADGKVCAGGPRRHKPAQAGSHHLGRPSPGRGDRRRGRSETAGRARRRHPRLPHKRGHFARPACRGEGRRPSPVAQAGQPSGAARHGVATADFFRPCVRDWLTCRDLAASIPMPPRPARPPCGY